MGIITRGILKGYEGLLVGFDSTEDEAILQFDTDTFVYIKSDMIEQHDQLTFDFSNK
jgi:hypothetical protein